MQSLTIRLIAYLFVAQLVAAFIPWLIIAYLASFGERHDLLDTTLEHYSFHRVSSLIVESIEPTGNGKFQLIPSKQLERRAAEDGEFVYAAMSFNSGDISPGASAELKRRLQSARDTDVRSMSFHIDSGSKGGRWGSILLAQTPYGRFYVAASGFKFHWADVVSFIIRDSVFEAVVFLVGWILSCLIVFIGLRQALSPLRRSTKEAEQIDLDSLGQGVAIGTAPTEMQPIILAMNGALARLDASVTQMRRFTASAAHELRTPLALLRARLDNADPSALKNDLLRDASRLQSIVEQLLASARLSSRQVTIDEPIELCEVLCRVVSDHAPLARINGRTIAFESEAEDVVVRGNTRAIESIVANLVDNAVRAEPIGGGVLVRVKADAVVEVVDHGEGVPHADSEAIFEPFWRKSEATPGTGLGLAIAKELMCKLQGRIWVEETPGGGATFKLSFLTLSCEARPFKSDRDHRRLHHRAIA
jgi:signal transduction histidine kinase